MNSYGTLFQITTWGESHGKAVGVVIDGCPSGLEITENELSEYLYKSDRPIIELATERDEPNKAEFLSGVYDGKTIGTPISIVIKNQDVKSKDYKALENTFRPGYGEYGHSLKYNSPYLSGGGRASGRECIARIAGGYIAEKVIKHKYRNYKIVGKLLSLAGININDQKSFYDALEKSLETAALGDSTGGLLGITIEGVPHGLGEPVFDGIDARLAAALMSIGSVKSVEIGGGRNAALSIGSKFNDDFTTEENKISFETNNSGGTLGGVTIGKPIELTLAIKPTPSIKAEKTGLTIGKELKKISVAGRHDKNITPRIIPIARATASLVILDCLMISGKISKDRLE